MGVISERKLNRRQLEYLPIDLVRPDPDNVRVHSKRQIKTLAKSIEAFGFNSPILIDRHNLVIAGHARLEALSHLNRTEVPVIRLDGLTPDQAKAYAIADNRLTDLSAFDERKLGAHLKALAEIDLEFDIEATGFTMGEIDLRIESLGELESEEPQAEEPLPTGPPVCTPGQKWRLGEHEIVCGSALEVSVFDYLLAGKQAACVFADPPYNVPIHGHVSGKGRRKHREFASAVGEMSGPEFTAFLTTACRLAAEVSAPGTVQFWCMDWRHIQHLLAAGSTVFESLLNICVWTKNNGGMGSLYRSQHEMVAVFKVAGAGHRNNVQLGAHGRNRSNVWAYPGAASISKSAEDGDLMAQHPTPKPIKMVADALLDVTARGDLVLDPFLGSGTTLLACERVGRRCRAIELDPLYVDLTIRRWQRLTGEDAILVETGETFAELEHKDAER